MSFKGMRCDDVDWTHLAQDDIQWRAVVDIVMNLRFP